MPHTSLTRSVRFAAAHRYRRPEWSDEQNMRVFGLCARPNYHGHSYLCEVTVSGAVDPVSGFVVDLGALDTILDREVKRRFDHSNINMDVPEFAEGKLIPSGENLARYIFERLQEALGAAVQVETVRVAEDDTLSATYSR